MSQSTSSPSRRSPLSAALLLTALFAAACAKPAATAMTSPASGSPTETAASQRDASDVPRAILHLPVEATQWGAGPEAAVKVAQIYGSPAEPGLFVERMLMPEGAKTPPHWHAHDELITVLSGSIYIGQGDISDEAAAQEVVAGGMVIIPARMHHFGGSKHGAVLQVQGIGPFGMHWLAEPAAPR